MKEQLQENDRIMLDMIPCGICRVAVDDVFTLLYANKFYYSLYGYTPEQAALEGFTEAKFILPAEDYDEIHGKVMDNIRKGEENFELEYKGKHRSGRFLWLLVRCHYDKASADSFTCAVINIEDRKQVEEELRVSMEENRIALRLSDKMISVYDVENRILKQTEQTAAEFGLPEVLENVPERVVEEGNIAPEYAEEYFKFYQSIAAGVENGSTVVKKRRNDGTFGWYLAKYALVYGQNGQAKKAVISLENVTERHEKELAYKKWSQYFASQEDNRIGYYGYNLTKDIYDREVGDEPPAYLSSFHTYTESMVYVAEHFVAGEDRQRFYNFFDREKLLIKFYEQQCDLTLEYLRKKEDGSLFWARASVQLLSDPYTGDIKMFLVTYDIDDEKRRQSALKCRIENDPLTGLLNRATFLSKMGEILDKQDFAMRHAIAMVDIDNFKTLNDSFGHQFGDLVLADIAGVLKRNLRSNDLCGRLGGDEFMIFLFNIPSDLAVEEKLQKLCRELVLEYPEKGKVSGSIGACCYPRDGIRFEDLYQKADIALYQAKECGRCGYAVYKQEKIRQEKVNEKKA